MKYDFNKKIDRMGTLSYKWEGIPVEFPENPKALPFWIADMEFACPEPIVKAVCERARHPIHAVFLAMMRLTLLHHRFHGYTHK